MEAKNPEGKLAYFLKHLEESGVVLKEAPQFKPARPWDQFRPEKPWDVLDQTVFNEYNRINLYRVFIYICP